MNKFGENFNGDVRRRLAGIVYWFTGGLGSAMLSGELDMDAKSAKERVMAAISGLGKLLRLRTFSLRTGLVLFVLIGVSFGFAGRWIQEVRERGNAQRALITKSLTEKADADLNVSVVYAPEIKQTWFVDGVRSLVHPEYEHRFQEIVVCGKNLDDATASNISNVFGVTSLDCGGELSESWLAKASSARGLRLLALYASITPQPGAIQLEQFSPPQELESLYLNSSDGVIQPEFVNWLCRSPRLQRISFDRHDMALNRLLQVIHPETPVTPFTGEFKLSLNQVEQRTSLVLRPSQISRLWPGATQALLDGISQRENVTCLWIESAILDDAAMVKKFCERSKVETLHLQNCDVTAECLREFGQLRNLKVLHLDWTPLSIEELEVLGTMKPLREIHGLWGADVEGLAQLQSLLPDCQITEQGERKKQSGDREL